MESNFRIVDGLQDGSRLKTNSAIEEFSLGISRINQNNYLSEPLQMGSITFNWDEIDETTSDLVIVTVTKCH